MAQTEAEKRAAERVEKAERINAGVLARVNQAAPEKKATDPGLMEKPAAEPPKRSASK